MTGRYELGTVVFGKWRIERKIGEGSFGTVYEIRREDFGQVYRAALKVIAVPQNEAELKNVRQEGMNDESIHGYFYGVVEDIVREFALMSHLKGMTNVVSCEDYEVIPHDNGMGWDILIRMELLTPLLEYAYDHPFSRRDIIQLGIDMCKALELCQRYNIIHRDIKPENIFVSDTGAFKLGDFGIARTAEKTMSGMSKKGTYSYMAPEVYRGSAYGFSVDTYSLGVVMYRLLNNNRLPFLPQPPEPITYSQREIALAKRMGGEQPPSPMNAGGRLGEIVLRACAFTPENRYSSPMQMRQELEAIQYGPEDAVLVYPSGDELALHENQYASQQSQVEVNTPESTRAIPAPEAVEATEKTESVFGGGAVNKPALEETAENMPEQAPEKFFAPAGGEPEEFWPEEGTEKTESIFGRGPEEMDLTDSVPDAGEGQTDGVKKRSPIARITAIIAAIFILALLLPGALWVLGLVDFSGLKKSTDPVVPESLQEYEAEGTLDRVYSENGLLKAYAVRSYREGNLSCEDIYNLQGQFEQETGYNDDGTISWVVESGYDNEGKLTKSCQNYVDGNICSYSVFGYDADGNIERTMRKETYDADGNLIGIYDGSGDMIEVTNIGWSGYDHVDVWLDQGVYTIAPVITVNIRTEFDDSTGLNPYENYDVSVLNADGEELPVENLLFGWSVEPNGLVTCELNMVALESGYYIIHVEVPDSNGNLLGSIDVSICVGDIGTIVNVGPTDFAWEDLVLRNLGTGGYLNYDGTNFSMNYDDVDKYSIWHMNKGGYCPIYCSAFGADRILDIDNAGVFDGNLVKMWTRTGYDVQYWDTVGVHVMGYGYGMSEMIVNMAKDESGEEYCLAWDVLKHEVVIRPVSQADEFCVWDIR